MAGVIVLTPALAYELRRMLGHKTRQADGDTAALIYEAVVCLERGDTRVAAKCLTCKGEGRARVGARKGVRHVTCLPCRGMGWVLP